MHVQVPDRATEVRDQRDFDEAVNRTGKVVLEALAGLGIFAAILMSIVALVQSGKGSEKVASAAAPATKQAAATAAAPVAVQTVDVKIEGSWKVGPDGKKHDAFTKTEYAVKVGQPLKLRIDNTDDVPHSITSPTAGVNIVAQPGTHVYTMVVHQAGRFQWYCMIPCDSDANGWAMQNPGYMSGYITAS